MEIHAWIFRGPDGTPLGSTGTLTDVTERHQAQAEMEQRATHDPLTGLPNRGLLGTRIADALVAARGAGTQLALLFLDLDRFKLVNDSLGHDAGDEVLVQIAQRLVDRCGPAHLVARFGGDEFVVLCEGLDTVAVEAFAEELRAAVAVPLAVGPRELTLTASIGVRPVRDIELAHDHPEAAAQLLVRDADAAMYVAKEAGRDRVAPFEDETRIRVVKQLDTESRLRTALSDGQLVLFYQPQYRLTDMHLVGLEALLRWVDPERGIVLPSEFIGVAEQTGLIAGLGNWALLEVCRQLASAEALGTPLPRVSVNVSARQLGPALVCTIESALEETGARPDRLCLEVTESALMAGTDSVLHSVNTLAGLGIGISLDDFGTGFSCLSYLQRLPLCELKIDRSFLSRIDRTDGHAIVAAIVRLAGALDLDTVAEGVERPIEMNLLREVGCDAVQGYLLGRPAPLEALVPPRQMTAIAR